MALSTSSRTPSSAPSTVEHMPLAASVALSIAARSWSLWMAPMKAGGGCTLLGSSSAASLPPPCSVRAYLSRSSCHGDAFAIFFFHSLAWFSAKAATRAALPASAESAICFSAGKSRPELSSDCSMLSFCLRASSCDLRTVSHELKLTSAYSRQRSVSTRSHDSATAASCRRRARCSMSDNDWQIAACSCCFRACCRSAKWLEAQSSTSPSESSMASAREVAAPFLPFSLSVPCSRSSRYSCMASRQAASTACRTMVCVDEPSAAEDLSPPASSAADLAARSACSSSGATRSSKSDMRCASSPSRRCSLASTVRLRAWALAPSTMACVPAQLIFSCSACADISAPALATALRTS
mmetsp:Transcript_36639/g.85577  ORF Transcript_36639/g.85577 Transcript_36639/m.85577 type:complete len:354 (+) Transcript_36639:874-1935(+)